MRTIVVACLLAALAFPAPAGQPQRKKPRRAHPPAAAPAVKRPAPVSANYGKYDFRVTGLDGAPLRLADHAGKAVLVTVWAPWCGPCKFEAPGFVRLYEKYHARGFDIVGIAVQTSEPDVRTFLQTYKIPWRTAIADSIAAAYGTYGLPDNYLFNKDGSLAKRFVGLTREEALTPLIEAALK